MTSLLSLFGVTHWTGGCDLECLNPPYTHTHVQLLTIPQSSAGGVRLLGFRAWLLGLNWVCVCIKLLVFVLLFVFLTLDSGVSVVGSLEGKWLTDGCWSPRHTLSPLGSIFPDVLECPPPPPQEKKIGWPPSRLGFYQGPAATQTNWTSPREVAFVVRMEKIERKR